MGGGEGAGIVSGAPSCAEGSGTGWREEQACCRATRQSRAPSRMDL